MKILADECVYSETIVFLRKSGHEVLTVTGLNLSSAPDRLIFQESKKLDCLLLTFDNDYGNIFKFPIGSNPGTIIVKIKPHNVENANSALKSLLEKTDLKLIEKSLTIVSKNKIRIRHAGKGTITLP